MKSDIEFLEKVIAPKVKEIIDAQGCITYGQFMELIHDAAGLNTPNDIP